MRSIIIQYGAQWLRAAGINLCVLTRDTHKSVRVGVSAVKFHQIILFLLFFSFTCTVEYILDEIRGCCTTSQDSLSSVLQYVFVPV